MLRSNWVHGVHKTASPASRKAMVHDVLGMRLNKMQARTARHERADTKCLYPVEWYPTISCQTFPTWNRLQLAQLRKCSAFQDLLLTRCQWKAMMLQHLRKPGTTSIRLSAWNAENAHECPSHCVSREFKWKLNNIEGDCVPLKGVVECFGVQVIWRGWPGQLLDSSRWRPVSWGSQCSILDALSVAPTTCRIHASNSGARLLNFKPHCC